MSRIVSVELWVVALFCILWLVGMFANWAMLGLLESMVRDFRKIVEAQIEEQP